MAPRNTPSTEPEGETATEPYPEPAPLSFGGDLGKLLAQAQRTQRWFISNPGEDTPIPEGAYVHRGYPVEMAGTVVAIETVPTRNGAMPVYVLDVGQGADFPLIRWGLTAQLLKSAHERHRVHAGDTIAASCPGLRDSKNIDPETSRPYQYEDWSMLVQRGDGTVPGAGIGASGNEEPF